MDIDFLKLKSQEKNKAKKKADSFNIDYTKVATQQKPPLAPSQPKKIIEPEKKESFWVKIKNKIAKPSSKKIVTLPLPPQAKKEELTKPQEEPKRTFPEKSPSIVPSTNHKNEVIKKTGEITVPPALIRENHSEKSKSEFVNIETNKSKKSSDNKGFLGVNLIPSELEAKLNPTAKIKNIFVYGIVSLCLIFLVYGGLLAYQIILFYQVEKMQANVKQVEEEIISYRAWQKKALQFNDKLEKVLGLLNKHIYWSNSFTFLQKITLPDVYYTNYNGAIDGTINLSVIAPSYEKMVNQITAYKQCTDITSVSVTTASGSDASQNTDEQGNITFNVTLKINPAILYSQQK